MHLGRPSACGRAAVANGVSERSSRGCRNEPDSLGSEPLARRSRPEVMHRLRGMVLGSAVPLFPGSSAHGPGITGTHHLASAGGIGTRHCRSALHPEAPSQGPSPGSAMQPLPRPGAEVPIRGLDRKTFGSRNELRGGSIPIDTQIAPTAADALGNRTVTVVPRPRALSTSIPPRWFSTIALTIANPRPAWPPVPVRARSAR